MRRIIAGGHAGSRGSGRNLYLRVAGEAVINPTGTTPRIWPSTSLTEVAAGGGRPVRWSGLMPMRRRSIARGSCPWTRFSSPGRRNASADVVHIRRASELRWVSSFQDSLDHVRVHQEGQKATQVVPVAVQCLLGKIGAVLMGGGGVNAVGADERRHVVHVAAALVLERPSSRPSRSGDGAGSRRGSRPAARSTPRQPAGPPRQTGGTAPRHRCAAGPS